ncbi:antitoxin component YwqK of YwqJK toxin-antitoxin module [Mucilaginibacter sp. UYP25]|uniref:toxin-antitoxin system YwqK family antitoxin n=1 Tax=unclassified Mucilaginibacter TaxID=2617802 RepID=UPI003393BA2B
MRRTLILAFMFSYTLAAAQHIPDYGINRVRLNEEDRTLLFETIPFGSLPNAVPGRIYFWYSAGKILHTQGGYSGKLLNGLYRSYYSNKNLMEEGAFSKGLQDGNWKKWNLSGLLTEVTIWQKGIQNGPFQTFDSTGLILTSGSYSKGLLDGQFKRHVTGDSVVTSYYKNGIITQPVSLWKKLNVFRRKKKADSKAL